MRVRARIEGERSIKKRLEALGEAGKRALAGNVQASAFIIQAGARSNAPVDTGALVNSIAVDLSNGGAEASVSANESYAAFQEFGTGNYVSVPPQAIALAREFLGRGVRRVNIRPRAYLFPAYFAELPRLSERLNRELKRLTQG